MEQVLIDRIEALHQSGTTQVLYFDRTPTSSEFAHAVQANQPLVIRSHGRRSNTPSTPWINRYLVDKLEGKELSIAVSPNGNADSIVGDLFVEPATVKLPLEAFLRKLGSSSPVHYLQSQNGNMSDPDGEYKELLNDVGREVPAFARGAFGSALPDAVNLWIGDQHSVTSLHKDPYENLYLVVRGSKEFTLLPPIEYFCLHEQRYSHACYDLDPITNAFTIKQCVHADASVPWIPVDPLEPDLDRYPRFKHAHPVTVRLEAGDMLYLPALWFHRVAQGVGPSPARQSPVDPQDECPGADDGDDLEGIPCAISVNWWCDMNYDLPLWDEFCAIRRATMVLDGRQAELAEEEQRAEGIDE